jgi:predicted phage tail protein
MMEMRKVHLHGRLAKYGGPYELDVASAAEAVHALGCQLKGFTREFDNGHFQVIRGDIRTGMDLDLKLCAFKSSKGDFHIVPVPQGAGKGKGIGKIVLGVALIAASIFTAGAGAAAGATLAATMSAEAFAVGGLSVSFASIAAFGLTMVVGGVSQLLTTAPKIKDYGSRNTPDAQPSFLFNGPVNVTEQGGPVPLIYGRVRCGTVVVSAGLRAEQIAA